MNKERWQTLMLSLGCKPAPETFNALLAAYSEKHRHYHTVQHISDCLAKLDISRQLARYPEEIEIALWFHDAIYDPYKSGNEEKSAQWACDFLNRNAVATEKVNRVNELILATKHEAVATDADAQLLVDIDLSILGAGTEAYAAFEKNVREEYKWVPAMVFRKKRAEILQSFVDRPQIYSTPFFYDRFEVTARANLKAAIATLTG